MKQEEFELLIKNDDTLNRLLNEKEIGVFANFSNKGFENEAFKKYIEKQYKESYKEIFEKNIGTSEEGKIINLFKSVEYLATVEFKEEVICYAKIALDKAYDKLNTSKLSFQLNEMRTDFLTRKANETSTDNTLSFLAIYIINNFGKHEDLTENKNKILNCCLSICDLLADADDEREPVKFNTYNSLVNSLGKIHDLGLFKKGYETHINKVSIQKTGIAFKAMIVVIIGILYFIIRAYFKLRNRL